MRGRVVQSKKPTFTLHYNRMKCFSHHTNYQELNILHACLKGKQILQHFQSYGKFSMFTSWLCPVWLFTHSFENDSGTKDLSNTSKLHIQLVYSITLNLAVIYSIIFSSRCMYLVVKLHIKVNHIEIDGTALHWMKATCFSPFWNQSTLQLEILAD